ncbi:hypothetical protein V9K92_14935 [Phyllobacterium sp. CCNWLW109]|uniref:hypothetical protein n=1 Tax=Phyllobacterium sp. CCNWLW109 TaxID=3127479 RepID=UPI003076CE6C
MFWFIGAVVLVAILWFCLKLLAAVVFSPEYSGRALLKQSLKKHGVDISRIPDAAINDIVKISINGARGIANYSDHADDKNWRANFVRQIEGQAMIIGTIMNSQPSSSIAGPTKEILARYGVINTL